MTEPDMVSDIELNPHLSLKNFARIHFLNLKIIKENIIWDLKSKLGEIC